jgi:hypothetical protein
MPIFSSSRVCDCMSGVRTCLYNTWASDGSKIHIVFYVGVRGDSTGWGTKLQSERSRVSFLMGSWELFIDLTLPKALRPWGRLSLWQKWLPGVSLWGKCGRCLRLTTLQSTCADYFGIMGALTSWSSKGLSRHCFILLAYLPIWIFRKLQGVVGTGWSWLRIGTGGGHLWVRWETFGFHKCGEFLD